MSVRCPHCGSRYELPEHLMGPAGAQVRCPDCRGVFAVARDGTVDGLGRPAPAPAAAAAAPSSSTRSGPDTVARSLVAELAAHAGEAPGEAFARGTLFSEWGPALAELYGEYRRRVGDGASGAPLRAALLERWGIELPRSDTV